ncbi:thioredoxin-like protein [Aspergillus sclerotioniger CBS 115572]|uniref:Thioredoxin-like protein n=1 Tax=Aspergillus sclerotioniger CBS 115572 TaxID=1450535 RepID=A0A317VNZ3_9EURO|nr:thioredoxin-like protein [Aspergillus sclerotioniger CBS 115572]PWY76056.1 thioredoxin-like protein [Aspergillus sclerotioniger CBS 115572]
MTVIPIAITSDPVCPWCYIGYRRLTKAIRLYQRTYPNGSQDTIHITWKPYFLDPDAPIQSIPYIDRMTQKLGAEKVAPSQAHLQRLGVPDGIRFRFGGRIGNTLRAHQVILLCERVDIEKGTDYTTGVVEGLFRKHFEEEADITDVETLVGIVGEVSRGDGLEEGRVRRWLENGEGVEEIQEMAERARKEGIRGVPWFRIGGEGDGGRVVTLNGAQDVEEFFQALIAYKEGGRRLEEDGGVGTKC